MTSLPPYPPREDAWKFAPPPVRRGWRRLAIGATIGAALLGTASVATLVAVGGRDFPASFDDSRVVDAVTDACDRLDRTVESFPVSGPGSDRLEAVDQQNSAIQELLDQVRRVPEVVRARDQPVNRWLGDWEELLAARTAYADRLETEAAPDFRVPRVDGERIDTRINQVGAPYCSVPRALTRPDAGLDRPV